MNSSDQRAEPSRLQVVSVIAFYMSAAIVMVIVNKAVLNSSPDVPLSFLFAQTMIAVVLLRIAAIFSPKRFHLDPLTLRETRTLLPLNVVGIAGLVFNTFCLRDVDMTFFQIARGLLLPITIAVSAVWTKQAPRRTVLMAALIVSVGFIIGVSPPTSSSTSFLSKMNPFTLVLDMGLIYGLLSSLLTAVHAVMGKTQVNRKVTIVQLAYNNNMIASGLLLPFLLWNGELSKMGTMFANRADGQWNVFLWGAAVTGLFGLFLSLAGLLSIKVTSPVAHMFSGAARSVIQTTLGVMIFGDILTSNRVMSLFLISAGTLYFTWVQNTRARPPPLPRFSSDAEKQPLTHSHNRSRSR